MRLGRAQDVLSLTRIEVYLKHIRSRSFPGRSCAAINNAIPTDRPALVLVLVRAFHAYGQCTLQEDIDVWLRYAIRAKNRALPLGIRKAKTDSSEHAIAAQFRAACAAENLHAERMFVGEGLVCLHRIPSAKCCYSSLLRIAIAAGKLEPV